MITIYAEKPDVARKIAAASGDGEKGQAHCLKGSDRRAGFHRRRRTPDGYDL